MIKFIVDGEWVKANKLMLVLCLWTTFTGVSNSSESSLANVGISFDTSTCRAHEAMVQALPSVIDDYELRLEIIAEELKGNVYKKYGEGCTIEGFVISGEITSRSHPTIKLGLLLASKINKSTDSLSLWLDSHGGLVYEAMKIGHVVSTHNLKTIVPIKSRCLSSCVIIYAAGIDRLGLGELGIHRPFSSEISIENISYEKYLAAYKSTSKLMKEYFSKYGVSPSLVDDMNVIPSDDMKILNYNEIKKYGLGFKNVASTEFKKAQKIKICGSEYYAMHLNFHDYVDSCKKRLGYRSWDEGVQKCWDAAHRKFPDYSKEFKSCKRKQSIKP